ncbi:hypothetical protein NBRC116601_27690 [Cognatishimia sp. WU-CL00825]
MNKRLGRVLGSDLLKITSRDIALTKALRREAFLALRQINILIVVMFPSLLLAIMEPLALASIPFIVRFLGTLAYTAAMIVFSNNVSTFICAKLAPFGVALLFDAMIGLFLGNVIFSAIILQVIPDVYVAEFGALRTYLTAVSALTILSWAAAYVYLSTVEEKFLAVINAAGYDLSVIPKFRAEQYDQLQPLLPHAIRGDIRIIEAQDKYIQISTKLGAHTLPLALTSAIERMDPSKGMRVHRSLWLSWTEMDRLVYENGNPRVIATDGAIWPVSRAHAPQLKRALVDRAAANTETST